MWILKVQNWITFLMKAVNFSTYKSFFVCKTNIQTHFRIINLIWGIFCVIQIIGVVQNSQWFILAVCKWNPVAETFHPFILQVDFFLVNVVELVTLFSSQNSSEKLSSAKAFALFPNCSTSCLYSPPTITRGFSNKNRVVPPYLNLSSFVPYAP